MENNNYVFRCEGITKKYGKQLALNNLSMNIRRGEIYGFVGENGSGKTTIMRVICGLIKADQGSYELLGVPSTSKEVIRKRKNIGAIVETPSIYQTMTLKDNMLLQGIIVNNNNIEAIKETLTLVGLWDIYENKKKVGNFSLGMRQRLGIAMALLKKPEFILLDEPMNGLDPEGVVAMRNLILDLNQRLGITFLISSHILNELGLIATSYGIISHGTMIKEITKDELMSQQKDETIIKVSDIEKGYELIKDLCKCEKLQFAIKIFGAYPMKDVLNALIKNDVDVEAIQENKGDIEKYYLSLIGGMRHA